jgi:hypothetical protein
VSYSDILEFAVQAPLSFSTLLLLHVAGSLQEGGLLLLAPEHRLSLKLKRLELGAQQGKQEVCKLLDQFAQLPFLDIMDEVDELLHHRSDW